MDEDAISIVSWRGWFAIGLGLMLLVSLGIGLLFDDEATVSPETTPATGRSATDNFNQQQRQLEDSRIQKLLEDLTKKSLVPTGTKVRNQIEIISRHPTITGANQAIVATIEQTGATVAKMTRAVLSLILPDNNDQNSPTTTAENETAGSEAELIPTPKLDVVFDPKMLRLIEGANRD